MTLRLNMMHTEYSAYIYIYSLVMTCVRDGPVRDLTGAFVARRVKLVDFVARRYETIALFAQGFPRLRQSPGVHSCILTTTKTHNYNSNPMKSITETLDENPCIHEWNLS